MPKSDQLGEKAQVKVSRQKIGTVITPEEFLSLSRPKGDLAIKIGKEVVGVTSLDRVYWPDESLTKQAEAEAQAAGVRSRARR